MRVTIGLQRGLMSMARPKACCDSVSVPATVRKLKAEALLTILKRLFGGKSSDQPVTRTRICVECGMPVAEHKEWCSILRGQKEMELKAANARG